MKVNEKTVTVQSSYQVFSRFMMIQQSAWEILWSTSLDLSPGPFRSLMEKCGVLPKAKSSKTLKRIFPLSPVYLKILSEFLMLWSWYSNYLKESTHSEMYLIIFWTESLRIHLAVSSLWVISMIQPQLKVWKEKQDLILVRFE